MPEGEVRITMRLDRGLTKKEKIKLAATKSGQKTLKLLKEKSPVIKARLIKEAPRVKSIVKSIGKEGWNLFKKTKSGKRIANKIKASKRVHHKKKTKWRR